MNSQVLRTVWCYIQVRMQGKFGNLSLLGVKGLRGYKNLPGPQESLAQRSTLDLIVVFCVVCFDLKRPRGSQVARSRYELDGVTYFEKLIKMLPLPWLAPHAVSRLVCSFDTERGSLPDSAPITSILGESPRNLVPMLFHLSAREMKEPGKEATAFVEGWRLERQELAPMQLTNKKLY